MLRPALAFLILALLAAVLGFSGLAGTSSHTARVLFVVFLVMSPVGLIAGRRSRREVTDWGAPTAMARGAGCRLTAMTRVVDEQRVSTVREAFQQHRLAQAQRRLAMFYLEHNLFEEARDARLSMNRHLRSACEEWRRTLGASG